MVEGGLESRGARRRAGCGRIMFDMGIIAMRCDVQASWPVAGEQHWRAEGVVKNRRQVAQRAAYFVLRRRYCAAAEELHDQHHGLHHIILVASTYTAQQLGPYLTTCGDSTISAYARTGASRLRTQSFLENLSPV